MPEHNRYDDLTDPIFDSEYQETYPVVRKVGAVLLAMVIIAAFVAWWFLTAPAPR
jgi:hypothetical protein